jgi:hypothetical protein
MMAAHQRTCLWVFGLLMVFGLAACGAADQQPGGSADEQPPAAPATNTPAGESATEQAIATSAAEQPPAAAPTRPPAQMPTPALRPRRTAVAALPQPATPAASPGMPTITSHADGWQLYRDEQAGFSIAFPPDWSASQSSAEAGNLVVAFGPAGGAGIQVVVQPGNPPSVRQPEQSSLVCERATAGGLAGTRCVNTATGRITTTLAGKGRTFIIATVGKAVDEATYGRTVDSFALVG